jgi:DNA-binding beta-propeller fold protein YncE
VEREWVWDAFLMPLRLVDNIAMGHHLHSVAVSRDGTLLYVALDEENCISIVDLASGGIAGRIDLPGRPADIAVSPNGVTAVVVGSQREPQGDRGKAYIIDLRTNEVTATFAAGFNPQSVVFSPEGRFYFICDFSGVADYNPEGGALMAFRAVDHLLIATIPTGDFTYSAAPSPDGNFVYASTTFAQGSLAIVDANIQEVAGYVTGMKGDPSGVAVSPGGTRVYVAALSGAIVNIVDAVNGISTQWVDVAGEPHALTINPDHRELYVAHGSMQVPQVGLMTVIDIDTHQVTQTLEFDGNGYRMTMSRDGSRVYVADTSNSQIVVFAAE